MAPYYFANTSFIRFNGEYTELVYGIIVVPFRHSIFKSFKRIRRKSINRTIVKIYFGVRHEPVSVKTLTCL